MKAAIDGVDLFGRGWRQAGLRRGARMSERDGPPRPHVAATVSLVRPPVCEICDADLDPADVDGGLVTFQPDDDSRDWRRRAAEEPGFVGHQPDTGWFCGAHIAAARDAARTLTFPEGMRQLRGASDQAELQWMEWSLTPVDAHAFAASLCSFLPALFEAIGLGAAPTLEQRTERRWNPMDGTQPPWCPYTDTTVDAGVGADGTSAELSVVMNHWNDDDVANASVSLAVGDHLWISAYRADGAGRDVDTLRLRRPTTDAVVALVAAVASGRWQLLHADAEFLADERPPRLAHHEAGRLEHRLGLWLTRPELECEPVDADGPPLELGQQGTADLLPSAGQRHIQALDLGGPWTVVDHPERAAPDGLVMEHGHQQHSDPVLDVGGLEAEDQRSRLGIPAVEVGVQVGDQQLDVRVVEPHSLDRQARLGFVQWKGIGRRAVLASELEPPRRFLGRGQVSVLDPPRDAGGLGAVDELADGVEIGAHHDLVARRTPCQLHEIRSYEGEPADEERSRRVRRPFTQRRRVDAGLQRPRTSPTRARISSRSVTNSGKP